MKIWQKLARQPQEEWTKIELITESNYVVQLYFRELVELIVMANWTEISLTHQIFAMLEGLYMYVRLQDEAKKLKLQPRLVNWH